MISANSAAARSGLRAGSALTIGVGGVTSPVYGPLNMVGNAMWTTGSSGIKTTNCKIEAEAEFDAVRIWIGQRVVSGATPNYKALIATTETGLNDTVARAWLPIVGGATYNSAIDSHGRGWKPVTFGGELNTPSRFADVALNNAQYTCSDWIDLASIPRADDQTARPLLLLRLAQTVASAPISSFYSSLGNFTTWSNASAEPWFRQFRVSTTNNNGVDTLANYPTATTIGWPMMVWVEFRYKSGRSVLVCGDSTHEGGLASHLFNNWSRMACNELSTKTKPITLANLSGSGHGQVEFHALLTNYINAGARPSDVILPGWSQNGFVATAAGVAAYHQRTLDMISFLKSNGIKKVWLTTGYAVNGYPAATDSLRKQCNNLVRALAATGAVGLIDNDSVISVDDGDGTSSIKPEYNQDNVHANPAGQRAIADYMKTVFV